MRAARFALQNAAGGLLIPHDTAPDILADAGEGGPEDFSGVVLEVGEGALILAAEAR